MGALLIGKLQLLPCIGILWLRNRGKIGHESNVLRSHHALHSAPPRRYFGNLQGSVAPQERGVTMVWITH
jgi:hypothetical protein